MAEVATSGQVGSVVGSFYVAARRCRAGRTCDVVPLRPHRSQQSPSKAAAHRLVAITLAGLRTED
jgi:hypothetical protein